VLPSSPPPGSWLSSILNSSFQRSLDVGAQAYFLSFNSVLYEDATMGRALDPAS